MSINFRDLPNAGKLILVSSDLELKSDAELAKVTNAKKNQAAVIFNSETGEIYLGFNGGIYPASGVYRYTYSFASQGGAVGAIELRGPRLEPNLDIIDGYYDVPTAFTSGGAAQFSLGTSSGAATNLKAAAGLGTNGTAGRKILVPDFHVNGITNIVNISTASKPVINITVADLTAGALELVLFTIPRTT